MRIIDLQRRLREIGRIRIGEQVPTRNGKTRPAKLETFRFTSRDRQVIDAAATRFGGTVTEWAAPDGQQWQVTSRVAEIPVIVPPGDMSFSQAYEQWSAGGCQVRCDGHWDHIADRTCHCDPEARACSIHTRLSVMVPDLPGIGVWRLDTQGYYAAVELGGVVDICGNASAHGKMLPARLRLEQRAIKRDGQTRRFAVPVLDLDVHPLALGNGTEPGFELEAAQAEGLLAPVSNLTPVPTPTEAERVLIPSVKAQLTAVDDPSARESKQTPIPRTGLKPRTVAEITGPGGTGDREAPAESTSDNPPGSSTEPPAVSRAAGDGTGEPANQQGVTVRDVAMKAGAVFKADYDAAAPRTKTRTVERLRHALIHACTKGEHVSLNDLDPAQLVTVLQRLDDITEGRITYRHEQTPTGGVTFTSASGKETTVLWSDIEPSGDAA